MGSPLLSIGVRAMAASYAQMQTTGHNIANAGVEGYSRQRVSLATAQGQFSGVGFFGRGVDVTSVERLQDQFLTREAATAKSLSAMDAVRAERMGQLEQVFTSGERGIGQSISDFFASMSDLASRPADGASRQVVLSRAQDLVLRFNEAGAQFAQLQTTVNQELDAAVTAVNGLAVALAKVNNDVAAMRGTGHEPNDLLDERERLLSRLSEYVQVTTIAAEDGTIGVFMGGGQRLVLGNMAGELQLTPDVFDASRSGIALVEGSTLRSLTAEALGGGTISGLLTFQNEDLTAAASTLGQLVRALADAVNEQQQLGVDLKPRQPTDPPEPRPLFGFDVAALERVLPASNNRRDGAGNFISDVSIEVVDPSQLRGTEYDLRIDPVNAGQWLLTHVPDDGWSKSGVADGDRIDGFILHFNNGPVAGERFRLQPVAQAASGVQRLLTDPLDLAAASPFVASAATTNTGTAAIGALRMAATPADRQGTATITFVGPDPVDPARMQYTWTLEDGIGAVIDSGAGIWTPGKPIPSPPDDDINGFALDLTGVPADNDVLTLAPTPYPASNNGNALSLNRLGSLALVGLTELSDGSLTGGLTFNERYVAALADVGVRTRGADSAAEISSARAAAAEAARADKAGVNLDEEAARLIQFQQSYQAAAKVLQIAQQVFSNLLDIAG